jgi:hypothetical protein
MFCFLGIIAGEESSCKQSEKHQNFVPVFSDILARWQKEHKENMHKLVGTKSQALMSSACHHRKMQLRFFLRLCIPLSGKIFSLQFI